MNNYDYIVLIMRYIDMPMDLADLRIFSAVVREGGVTRAAERLHRVQSNISTRIRQLEAELGAPLFIREGKRLILAPAGQTLLDYADRILDLAEQAKAAVQDQTPRGIFRLGSMESTAAVRLPDPLTRFSTLYPTVELDLRTGNPTQLASAILAGEIDAALVAEPAAISQFDVLTAFVEELVIVTADSHPKIDDQNNTPRTILVFEHGCPHRRQLEAWYAGRNTAPERIVELGSYHAMLGCVVAGMGAALLPRSVLSTFPDVRRLRIHKLDEGENALKTLLIWPKGIAAPNVKALADILSSNSSKTA